ncbi:glycosyltransferase family 39 protein [soil metagenome]
MVPASRRSLASDGVAAFAPGYVEGPHAAGSGVTTFARADATSATVFWPMLAVLAWFSFSMAWRGLAPPDEGRYIGVAYEMLRSGDWVVPTLDGLPFFHKPPLFYWIAATSLHVFGLHDWAGRVPSLIGASAAAFALYAFTRRWSGSTRGRSALLVLVTQPGFFLGAQFANLDMLVAGGMSVTIVAVAHAVLLLSAASSAGRESSGGAAATPTLRDLANARRWLVAGWAAAALGVLAKGLIGLVLPGLVILAWLLFTRRLRLLTQLLWWPGPLLFLAVAAPWFVAMQLRFRDFFDYFIVEQHFRRFAGSGFNNAHSFWFYVPVVLLMLAPWSPWLVNAWRGRKTREATEPAGTIRILMWTWTLVIVGFFSLPASKLVGYVLAALPPLAWIIMDAARSPPGRVETDGAALAARWWRSTAICAAIVCVAVGALAARYQPRGAGAIAERLALKHADGEPVFMLDTYLYDLPFKARLQQPVRVIDDWLDPDLPRRDNFRKELFDAGRFAPSAASRTLVNRADAAASMCDAPVSWIVGAKSAADRYPFLANLEPQAEEGDRTLWRLDRATSAWPTSGCSTPGRAKATSPATQHQ